MHVQDMAQNTSFLDEIDRKATKVQADAHFQESLPGRYFAKNYSDLHNNRLGIIFSGFKAYLRRVHISSV